MVTDMKPTLLYVSPFWPQKSGISEYSENLIWGLKEYFEITVLTKTKKISNQNINDNFMVMEYKADADYSEYDYIIYNFGNNPEFHDYMYDMIIEYSGYVILHDFSLYYLTVDHYRNKNMLFQKIYELEGVEGITTVKERIRERKELDLLLYKDLSPILPLNREILRCAKGVFVHSDYTKNKILESEPEAKVFRIELVDCMPEVQIDEKDYLREKYHWEKDTFIIGAVGMIAPSKQNELTCKAVQQYNATHEQKIKYVMIGEGDYVNNYLSDHIVKTGFLENKDFFNAINSCDIIFNLRYPYNGESSATLMQCMLMGKQCVVTDIGWFGELPDECVKKVEVNISAQDLSEVLNNIVKCRGANLRGRSFVEEKCNCKVVAENIEKFLKEEKIL